MDNSVQELQFLDLSGLPEGDQTELKSYLHADRPHGKLSWGSQQYAAPVENNALETTIEHYAVTPVLLPSPSEGPRPLHPAMYIPTHYYSNGPQCHWVAPPLADDRVNGTDDPSGGAEPLAVGGVDAKAMAAPVQELTPDDVALMAAHQHPDPSVVPPVTVAAAGPGMSHGPPHHQDYHSAGMPPAQHPITANMYMPSYGMAPSMGYGTMQFTYQGQQQPMMNRGRNRKSTGKPCNDPALFNQDRHLMIPQMVDYNMFYNPQMQLYYPEAQGGDYYGAPYPTFVMPYSYPPSVAAYPDPPACKGPPDPKKGFAAYMPPKPPHSKNEDERIDRAKLPQNALKITKLEVRKAVKIVDPVSVDDKRGPRPQPQPPRGPLPGRQPAATPPPARQPSQEAAPMSSPPHQKMFPAPVPAAAPIPVAMAPVVIPISQVPPVAVVPGPVAVLPGPPAVVPVPLDGLPPVAVGPPGVPLPLVVHPEVDAEVPCGPAVVAPGSVAVPVVPVSAPLAALPPPAAAPQPPPAAAVPAPPAKVPTDPQPAPVAAAVPTYASRLGAASGGSAPALAPPAQAPPPLAPPAQALPPQALSSKPQVSPAEKPPAPELKSQSAGAAKAGCPPDKPPSQGFKPPANAVKVVPRKSLSAVLKSEPALNAPAKASSPFSSAEAPRAHFQMGPASSPVAASAPAQQVPQGAKPSPVAAAPASEGPVPQTPAAAAKQPPVPPVEGPAPPARSSYAGALSRKSAPFSADPNAVMNCPFSHQDSDSPAWEPKQNVAPASKPISAPPLPSLSKDPELFRLGEHLSKHKLNYNAPNLQPRGLSNRSNWCYIHATLQALLACPPFYNLIKSLSHNPKDLPPSESYTPIIDSIAKFIQEFPRVKKPDRSARARDEGASPAAPDVAVGAPFEPTYVYKMLSAIRSDTFKVEGRQEDAEEFLSCLLNGLHDEMLELMKMVAAKNSENPIANGDVATNGDLSQDEGDWSEMGSKKKKANRKHDFGRTPLSDIFRGILRSCVVRDQTSGGHIHTHNVQPFFTLQLDVEKAKSVNEALERYGARDQLEGMTCAKTKKEVTAWQQVELEELPPVLLLHLKCFNYKLDGCSKICRAVEYPIDLKVQTKSQCSTQKSGKPPIQKMYKLFAVVYHDGKEATKGHYVADAYHPGYCQWLRYDDSTVTVVGQDEVLHSKSGRSRTPYLLYYRRQDASNS